MFTCDDGRKVGFHLTANSDISLKNASSHTPAYGHLAKNGAVIARLAELSQ